MVRAGIASPVRVHGCFPLTSVGGDRKTTERYGMRTAYWNIETEA